jgi:hypothetical protein
VTTRPAGLPVSTTQTITGALIAIGLTEGLKGVNWRAVLKVHSPPAPHAASSHPHSPVLFAHTLCHTQHLTGDDRFAAGARLLCACDREEPVKHQHSPRTG